MTKERGSKTLFEITCEGISGEDIEVLRERPLSEMHDKIRQRNKGKIPCCSPSSALYGSRGEADGCTGMNLTGCSLISSEQVEKLYRQAIKIPWHEGMRRLYYKIFG